MRKNSSSKSAFFSRRLLIGFVLCLTGVFLALVVFGQNRWDKSHLDGPGAVLTVTESPEATPTPTPTPTPAMTFTVTNTGDNGGVNPPPGAGTGTLRQAIIDSNANPPPPNTTNLIQFN